MKKITIIIIAILCSIQLFAQAPQSINYQAVARDASGNIMASQSITVQINILQGSVSGTAVCSENFSITTNNFGLINLQIGSQNPTAFAAIDWATGPYYAEVSINGNLFGTSQLLSVPYALHSETTDSLVNFSEIDPVFNASVAAGINTTDTAYWNAKLDSEMDGDPNNEIQTISRSGQTVTLSNSGGTYTDSVNVYTEGDGININNNVVSTDLDFILPAGMIIPFAGDTNNIPNGWLLCDGSEVSRTTYARLYATIDTIWGLGDTATTFNLPDFRGTFMRGTDLGTGNDPDAAGRTATNGGNSGDKVGSVQEDEFKSHNHTYTMRSGADCHNAGPYCNIAHTTANNTSNNTGGNETRPKNKNVHYLIKY